MKRASRRRLIAGILCGLACLGQAAVSWGSLLSTETQIDTITITSDLGVTFSDIASSVSGQILSNGALVATGSAIGAGSFTTVVDGSSGPLPTTYANAGGTKFGFLGTTVAALPSAPTSNPLIDDFVVLGNSVVASLGGKLTASDTATYQQTFSISGTGPGTLSLGAFGLYNFNLTPDGFIPFTANAMASLDFLLTGGLANVNQRIHFGFGSTDTANMFGLDVPLLGSFDAFGNPVLGDIFGPIAVNGGDTFTFTATAGSFSELTVVPEPGSFLLLGAGIAGLAFYRRRARCQAA